MSEDVDGNVESSEPKENLSKKKKLNLIRIILNRFAALDPTEVKNDALAGAVMGIAYCVALFVMFSATLVLYNAMPNYKGSEITENAEVVELDQDEIATVGPTPIKIRLVTLADALRMSLISFAVLSAIFFTAWPVVHASKDSVLAGSLAKAAYNMTLGVLLLFIPVILEWFTHMFVIVNVQTGIEPFWLIYGISMFLFAFAVLGFAFFLLFAGLIRGISVFEVLAQKDEVPILR